MVRKGLKKTIVLLLKVYAFTLIFAMLIITVLMYRSLTSFSEVWDSLKTVLFSKNVLIAVHILFAVCLILFLLVRHFVRGYKNGGFLLVSKRLALFLLLPVSLLFLSYKTLVNVNSNELYDYVWSTEVENTTGTSKNLYKKDGKHRGMSVFRLGGGDHPESMQALIKDHVEWVAVIPFLYQENEAAATLRTPDREIGTWSRRDSTVINKINLLHEQGMQVHLKPHVWLGDGWRSNLNPIDNDWEAWFKVYQQEMVHYARIAQQTGVGLYCIGTELRTVIQHQPDAWQPLIKAIKEVYKGKLTYAANWDDPIDSIPFWEEMDYIGIQAYFPLTEGRLPEIATIKEGWEQHLPALESAAKKYNKPVLFTEIGYRSDVSATIRPWEWGNSLGVLYNKKSDRTQQFAYEALFETLWDKDWFAGCYIWQWHAHTKESDAVTDVDFTPRFKPAENTIAKWYGRLGAPVR